jgi:hypothetical protein
MVTPAIETEAFDAGKTGGTILAVSDQLSRQSVAQESERQFICDKDGRVQSRPIWREGAELGVGWDVLEELEGPTDALFTTHVPIACSKKSPCSEDNSARRFGAMALEISGDPRHSGAKSACSCTVEPHAKLASINNDDNDIKHSTSCSWQHP